MNKRGLLWILLCPLSTYAAEKPLSFEEALSQILSRSTAIEIQKTSLLSAEAKRLPTQYSFLPLVSFGAGESLVKTGSASTVSSSKAEATAQINLLRWGADWAEYKAADWEVKSQQAKFDLAKLEVEDTAIRALLNQIQKSREVEINQGIVKTQSELLKIARQRYERGFLASQEVDKVAVDLANAEASLSDSHLHAISAQTSLENLLGHSNVQLDWPWKERISQTNAEQIIGKAPSLGSRPAWRATEAKRESEDARLSRSVRLMLPSIDGSFSYGKYSSQTGGMAPIGGGSTGWTVGLTVTLPLFERLAGYAGVQAQTQALLAAESALTQASREAQSDWESARKSFSESITTALAREKTLAISRKIYQDNLRRFQAGRTSVNDLAIDQKRLFDSELFAVQGWSSAHLAYSRLCHSVGKPALNCSSSAQP